MIAAQLIAAHNATMECYRRAMIGDQTLEGRRDNLSQANKLSRTCAVLLDALNRYRGKGGLGSLDLGEIPVRAAAVCRRRGDRIGASRSRNSKTSILGQTYDALHVFFFA